MQRDLRSIALDSLAPLQPLGIASAQILSFCSTNAGEVGLADASRSLTITAIVVLLAWLALLRPCRGARPAAFAVSLLAFGFWSSRPVATWLASWTGLPTEPTAGGVIALMLAGAAGVGLWIRRSRRNLSGLYRVADAMALVSVAIPLAMMLSQSDRSEPALLDSGVDSGIDSGIDGPTSQTVASDRTGRRPDIYWIVLDAYGRDDELEKHFGISQGLGARLEAHGFYVASESRTNYTSTLHAIPSILNYEYVQTLLNDRPVTSRRLVDLSKRSRLVRRLQREGYRVVSYDTGIELSQLRQVDEFVEPPAALELAGHEVRPSYFERGLLGLSVLDLFLRRTSTLSDYALHRNRVLHALEDLPRHAYAREPTFVFAHILSPHEPFVFGRNGEDVSPTDRSYALSAISEDPLLPDVPGGVGPTYARQYADQASYLADLVEDTVASILARSAEPPIIVIQGDHGPYGFSPDIRIPRAAILNAYFLPGDGAARLYPSITPVNSARVILQEYFGETEPLRDDRTYYAEWKRPDLFTPVE